MDAMDYMTHLDTAAPTRLKMYESIQDIASHLISITFTILKVHSLQHTVYLQNASFILKWFNSKHQVHCVKKSILDREGVGEICSGYHLHTVLRHKIYLFKLSRANTKWILLMPGIDLKFTQAFEERGVYFEAVRIQGNQRT